MKNLDDCNYYDLLDIPPDAPKITVQEAYFSSHELFDEHSVVSYNFLSQEEREEMLDRLRHAYETLIDEQKRIEYDKKTFQKIGRWHQSADKDPGGARIFTTLEQPNAVPGKIRLQDFMGNDGRVSLQKLREACGITPEELYRTTRIRPPMIHALEQRDFRKLPPEIYVKGYLKSCANCLGVDPEQLIRAYGPLTRKLSE